MPETTPTPTPKAPEVRRCKICRCKVGPRKRTCTKCLIYRGRKPHGRPPKPTAGERLHALAPCGYELRTLYDSQAEEKERARRARIYHQQVLATGRIDFGAVPHADEAPRLAASPLIRLGDHPSSWEGDDDE